MIKSADTKMREIERLMGHEVVKVIEG